MKLRFVPLVAKNEHIFISMFGDYAFNDLRKYSNRLIKEYKTQQDAVKQICVPGNFHIEEFYIAREFRGKGFGEEAAKLIFEMYGTEGSLCILERNIPAIKFWTKMFKKYTAGVKCQRDTINVECYLYSFVPVVKECYYG